MNPSIIFTVPSGFLTGFPSAPISGTLFGYTCLLLVFPPAFVSDIVYTTGNLELFVDT